MAWYSSRVAAGMPRRSIVLKQPAQRHSINDWTEACPNRLLGIRLANRSRFVPPAKSQSRVVPNSDRRMILSILHEHVGGSMAVDLVSPDLWPARADRAPPTPAPGDHFSSAVSNAAKRGWGVGENGLVTVTPRHVKPSWRSSDRSKRHSASAAAARTTESQIESP